MFITEVELVLGLILCYILGELLKLFPAVFAIKPLGIIWLVYLLIRPLKAFYLIVFAVVDTPFYPSSA
jgi:hypothetical protein